MTPPGDGDRAGHLSENELAGLLDRDLAAADRRRIEAHLDVCHECRAELVEMRRLLDAHARRERAGRVARRWWVPTAVAAALAVLLLAPRGTVSPGRRGGERAPAGGEGRASIAVVSPAEGSTVAAGPLNFAWHATGADLYRITLLSESGQPLWTQETTDTSLSLPASVAVEKGRRYFWRVDAIANGIAASTGARLLQVSP